MNPNLEVRRNVAKLVEGQWKIASSEKRKALQNNAHRQVPWTVLKLKRVAAQDQVQTIKKILYALRRGDWKILV